MDARMFNELSNEELYGVEGGDILLLAAVGLFAFQMGVFYTGIKNTPSGL